MAGTVSTPIFKQDGQQIAFTVGGTDAVTYVTLGDVVVLGTDGTVNTTTTSAHAGVIGIAIAGNRVSRTATDNRVYAPGLVTVLTRGVANVTAKASSGIAVGDLVETCDAAGQVDKHTLGASNYIKALGKALTAVTTAGGTVTVFVNLI